MKIIPAHYKGEQQFLKWAITNRPAMSECNTLMECLISPYARSLKSYLSDYWDAPVEALAVMVGMRATLPPNFDDWDTDEQMDMVAAWGYVSRESTNSIDINESRFSRWVGGSNWDDFFDESITAMRVLKSYRQPFNVKSVYRWVRFKCETMDEPTNDFTVRAAQCFYSWQRIDRDAPNAVTDHDPSLAPMLIQKALDAGYSKTGLAQRCGISRQYLDMLIKREREISFPLQALLQHFADGSGDEQK